MRSAILDNDEMSRNNITNRSDWKLWAGLIVLVAAFAGVQQWLSATQTAYERRSLPPPTTVAKKRDKLPEASMIPGRVVDLETTRGRISIVLFEKDCPVTTSRVAELVQQGCYDGVKFTRVVKDQLIQTGPCSKQVKPIGLEVLNGLINTKGAVGMARTSDPNSATSQFYILLEPLRHLDYDYTVFGRLIDGMDVAFKIGKTDSIKHARLRRITERDKKLFEKVLRIEAERETE